MCVKNILSELFDMLLIYMIIMYIYCFWSFSMCRKKMEDHTLMASSFMQSSIVAVAEEFLEATH
jgi:hypothetical protein